MICRDILGYRSLVRRTSFTLVELMISISIMGILASASMFALYGVMEDAKEARTRAQIARLNELILDRWDEFQSRPVPIVIPPTANPRIAGQMRLAGLRELMRMELPDRKSDVIDGAVTLKQPNAPTQPLAVSRWRTYQRRGRAMIEAKLKSLTPPQPLPNPWHNAWTKEHHSAECLYLIVASIQDGDTNGLSYFRDSEIGDIDDDGMPELLDGWGNPIYFLRWAPAFLEYSDIQVKNSDLAPDPFDPLKVDPRWTNDGDPTNDPFALYPVIYSGGRDGARDMYNEYNGGELRQSVATPYPNDPYHTAANGIPNGIGEPGPNDADNITNHLLGAN